MGKHTHTNMQRQETIQMDDSYRGCMWGLLHVLDYHRWRYVKRRLHHGRHGAERHSAGDGNPGSSVDTRHAEKFSKFTNDNDESLLVNHKKREPIQAASKNSMKSRMRYLIADEKFRRKGRHHRSSTAPVPLLSIQTDGDSQLATPRTDAHTTTSRRHGNSKRSALREAEPLLMDITAPDGHIVQDQVDDHGKQPITHARYDEEKLGDVEQHCDMHGLHYQPTNYAESLDIAEGINKELLLKFIHEAGAFSAQQRKEYGKRGGLRRSGTFPLPGLHIGKVPEESTTVEKHGEVPEESTSTNKHGEAVGSKERSLQNGNQDTYCAESESSGNVYKESNLEAEEGVSNHNKKTAAYAPVVVKNLRSEGKNLKGSRRFKAFKQKIKHAMKVNRKEKHRIAMDGILHRIPGDKEFSEELMEEMIRRWKEATVGQGSPTSQDENNNSITSFGNSGAQGVLRTPSLEASLHKYAQLFESSVSTEAKQQDLPLPASTPNRKMGRIFSLPELKSYSFRAENDSDYLSSETPMGDGESDKNTRRVKDVYSLIPPLGSDNKPHVHASEEVTNDEQADAISYPPEYFDGTESSKSTEDCDADATVGALEHELFELPVADYSVPSSKKELSYPSSLSDSHQEEDTGLADIDTSPGCIDEEEMSSKALDDLMRSQIHLKDREFFDYVRDVLEKSGFSGKESLGIWRSDDQPLDRAVYDEVEDIWLCCENEQGTGCWDRVLLFDLINEVLLDICKRSFSYYPRTLSPLCQIRRMPGGYRVLEEVWVTISGYISLGAGLDCTMDYVTCKDLEKQDNWMNLQCDSEGVGIELESLILDDLLEELIFT